MNTTNSKYLAPLNGWNATRMSGLAFLTLLSLPASAVTVLNNSFEDDVLAADGAFTGIVTNWVAINVNAAGGGAYNPDGTNFTGATGSGTPTGADGVNVFSTAVTATPGSIYGSSQLLTGTSLTAGTIYTLTVAIGDYANLPAVNWNLGISTSSMAFTSFLNTASGTAASLTNDAFADFSVSYTATGLEIENLEDLKITVWAESAGTAGNVPFDNVRFTAVIPEPSSVLIGSLGALALLRRRRN